VIGHEGTEAAMDGCEDGASCCKDCAAFGFSKMRRVLSGDMTVSKGNVCLRKTYVDIGLRFADGSDEIDSKYLNVLQGHVKVAEYIAKKPRNPRQPALWTRRSP
jgi:hypothetical protein